MRKFSTIIKVVEFDVCKCQAQFYRLKETKNRQKGMKK